MFAAMGAELERRWKVGDLAEATGLTVRTLHHYDDVGLLVPSERTSAGHRLYAEQDVRRLYRILALRRLGMRLDEISSLLEDDGVGLLDTVRRHLEQVERELERQRVLRERLCRLLEALERSVEPPAVEFIGAIGAMTVVEAEVEDVLLRIPADEVDEPPPRLARERYRVVLLKERHGERVVPIFIRASEGDLLAAGVGGWSQPRPMGPDLTTELLEVGGVRVQRVVVERVEDGTFYATVTVSAGGESHELDARPSDALNLAVRVGAPVFVAAEVIDQGGVPADRAGRGEEWRSLSPELMRSLYPREAAEEFERFTKPAFRALAFAREEAGALRHDEVRPEHILLGLLREEGTAARVLDSLGVTAERVRGQLGPGEAPEAAAVFVGYTPQTQKVLQLALGEEPTRRPDAVGTEHLLLGLLGADEQTLLDFGVEPDRIREEVRRAVRGRTAEEFRAAE